MNTDISLTTLLQRCLSAAGKSQGMLFIQIGNGEVKYHFCAHPLDVISKSEAELIARVIEHKSDVGALNAFAERLSKLDVPLLEDTGKERELRSALEDLVRKVAP